MIKWKFVVSDQIDTCHQVSGWNISKDDMDID